MFTKILVAVDGSERALAVLTTARDLATRFNALLCPFRAVMIPPEFPPGAQLSYAESLSAHLIACASEELAALMLRAPALQAAVPLVRVGPAWRSILDVAEEIKADLIVIGSHGYGGWDRVIGTTAARVVNHAHRNVLVVHESTRSAGA